MRLAKPVDLHDHKGRMAAVLPRIGKTSRIQHHQPVGTILQIGLMGMAEHDDIHLPRPGFFFNILRSQGNAVHMAVAQKRPVLSDGNLLLRLRVGKEIIISPHHMDHAELIFNPVFKICFAALRISQMDHHIKGRRFFNHLQQVSVPAVGIADN